MEKNRSNQPLEIHSEFNPKEIIIKKSETLKVGFVSLDFNWLKNALVEAKSLNHFQSCYEYEEVMEHACCKCIGAIVAEVISNGKHVTLLVEHRPIAQYDLIKSDIKVVFFNYPELNQKEANIYHTLHASKSYFEIRKEENSPILCYIRQEESQMNAIRINRSINLTTSEQQLNVEVDRSDIHEAPTIQNLVNWIANRDDK